MNFTLEDWIFLRWILIKLILHLARMLYMGHVRKVSQPMKKTFNNFLKGLRARMFPSSQDIYIYTYGGMLVRSLLAKPCDHLEGMTEKLTGIWSTLYNHSKCIVLKAKCHANIWRRLCVIYNLHIFSMAEDAHTWTIISTFWSRSNCTVVVVVFFFLLLLVPNRPLRSGKWWRCWHPPKYARSRREAAGTCHGQECWDSHGPESNQKQVNM